MKLRCVLVLFLLGCTLTSFGQKAHIFKPWKSQVKFDKKEIVFLVDTTGTADETKVLLIIASKIDDNLKGKEITPMPIPYPNNSKFDGNVLCLKLKSLDKAYVKLNTFESAIPLCFRLRLTQMQPSSNKPIETDIAFSIEKKQQGVDELGADIAERLLKHFN